MRYVSRDSGEIPLEVAVEVVVPAECEQGDGLLSIVDSVGKKIQPTGALERVDVDSLRITDLALAPIGVHAQGIDLAIDLRAQRPRKLLCDPCEPAD
jgi:hypothetical protein